MPPSLHGRNPGGPSGPFHANGRSGRSTYGLSIPDSRITVRALSSGDGAPVAEAAAWTEEADGDGLLHLPSRYASAWLAVTQPPHGFRLGLWRPPAEGEAVIQLPPGGDLVVRAVTSAAAPQQFSPLVLWVGPVRIEGWPLTWLTGVPAMTDREGLWRGQSLPTGNFAVMVAAVTDAEAARRIDSGQLDNGAPRSRTSGLPSPGGGGRTVSGWVSGRAERAAARA